MSKTVNPIHWESLDHGPAKVIDLRTLPEEVKVGIIHVALRIAVRVNNGSYDEVPEGSEAEEALGDLSLAVEAVRPHMHPVDLVPAL